MSLVAWYPLNGNLKDITDKYNLNLLDNIEPNWTDGKTGRNCLNLSENVIIASVSISELINRKSLSISYWLRNDTGSGQFTGYLGFQTKDTNGNGFFRSEASNTTGDWINFFEGRTLINDSGFGSVPTTPNEWAHITFAMDGTTAYIYKNGKLHHSKTYGSSNNENTVFTGLFRIGQLGSNHSESYYGALNNIKIYDHCLSKEEAYQDYLSPMLHYTFENPYVEETENINDSVYNWGTSSNGSDIKGNYFIKSSTNQWNGGVWLNNITVYGGNYYTWSLEINPDTDLTVSTIGNLFDPNLISLTYTGNDSGRPIIDFYKGNIPKNTWTRVWITCYIDQTVGRGRLNHALCPLVPSGVSQIKVYYRNVMLEKKDHMTPYTKTKRPQSLIRDNSGQGNDGKIIYRREEIPITDNVASNNYIWTVKDPGESSYEPFQNQRLRIGNMAQDNRYFYVGSVISYEFDIKLDSTSIVTGKDFDIWLQGQTFLNDSTAPWIDGSPVHVVKFPSRLRNGTNGTYHITIEKEITNITSVTNAIKHNIELRIDFLNSGTVTISNFHAYYQNLDTSTLGITDRNNAIGTHSVYFNGKSRINCGIVTPDEMDELTLSCWIYQNDWINTNFLNGRQGSIVGTNFNIANVESGGFGFKVENGTNTLNLCVKHTDQNWSTDCLFNYTTLSPGWHLFTGIATKNKKQIYVDGELKREVTHNNGNTIINHADSYKAPFSIGGEICNTDPSNNLIDVYLDDVRLYPTALTAEEVKALYRTKAKIDKDSNMYTNQLVETKQENMFIFGSDPTLIPDSGLSKFMSNGTFTRQDRILTYTATSITTNQIHNGFYINNSNYGGSLKSLHQGKRFRYSFYVKVSSSGIYGIGEEYVGATYKILEAGKWYYIEKDDYANKVNTNFVFYKKYEDGNSSALAVGDTISVRDIHLYEIDDDLLPIERDTDPKITKKAQIKGFELNEIDYDRLTKRQNIIEKEGAKWVEVFYHNTNNNTVWFTDEAEALHCTSEYKYSRLDCLEQYRQSDGKFEFLLEYPEIPDQFNRWKQTDNPATTEEVLGTNITTVNGYEAIHIDWSNKFGGLLKHINNSDTRCFLDGTTSHGNWYYCIGCYNNSTIDWPDAMPGQYQDSSLPGYSSNNPAHEVRLYARISDEQINLGPTIINKYGAQWLEVFYHNNHSGTVLFADREEAMHTIRNKDKYSILDCLEQYRGKDNKFEFLLEYPTENPNQYNRWKQTSNPLETKDTRNDVGWDDSSIVEGCEPIHLDWLTRGNKWCGLISSIAEQCLIDGTIGTNWHFAIGANTSYLLNGFIGIPGPRLKKDNTNMPAQNYIIQNDVHLYVRIDNINNRQQIAKLTKLGNIKTKGIKEV